MERLGRFFCQLTLRLLPDALVLAFLLTLLVMAAALVAPPAESLRALGAAARIGAVADLWLQGLANASFLEFALQMCLVLLTGYGLAKAPAAERLLEAVAGTVTTNRGAAALVALVSAVGCWINWGFGLIVAGLLAGRVRERFTQRGRACQYPLIVAAAYVGMMTWHGGLSGSAPLRVSKDGVEITRTTNAGTERINSGPITVDRTIFAPINLALSLALFIGVPLAVGMMAGGEEPVSIQPLTLSRAGGLMTHLPLNPPLTPPSQGGQPQEGSIADDDAWGSTTRPAFADRVNHSVGLRLLFVLAALVALGVRVYRKQWSAIDLNFVILVFLTLGLSLHRDVMAYLAALMEGGQAVVGIIIQFPLYGGIEKIMAGSGIVAAISNGFVAAAQGTGDALGVGPSVTFPLATFAGACVVNTFIPSGGVQWMVQGPIMCSAADQLGLPLAPTVMAVAYGDQFSNMIQPFWAIPLMGLTRVNPREFLGYCALLMLLATPAFVIALMVF